MFLHIPLNRKELFCFNFKNKWFFLLAQFCDVMFQQSNQHFDYLLEQLQAFEKTLPKRGKPIRMCCNFEEIAAFIAKESNNWIVRPTDSELICIDEKTFTDHCKPFAPVAVELQFFCEYLNKEHESLYAIQQSSRLELLPFCKYLIEKLNCPFWAFIFENKLLLEPLIQQYLYGELPKRKNFAAATNELQEYLDEFRKANVNKEEEKEEEEDKEEEKDKILPLCVSSTFSRKKMTSFEKPAAKKRKVTKQDKVAIASSQNWLCHWCKNQLESTFHIDHIEEFSATHNDHYTNLWALCPNCHARKTEMDRKKKRPSVWCGYKEVSKLDDRTKVVVNKINQWK